MQPKGDWIENVGNNAARPAIYVEMSDDAQFTRMIEVKSDIRRSSDPSQLDHERCGLRCPFVAVTWEHMLGSIELLEVALRQLSEVLNEVIW